MGITADQVRTRIKKVAAQLAAMVAAGEISQAQADTLFLPLVLKTLEGEALGSSAS